MASNLPFVKFQRGTQAQYNRLKNASGGSRLEADALYFIYDSTKPEDGGLLYLGDVLIGGTGSAVGASSLNDLTDIDLSGVTLLDGMILQYNNTSHKWEPVAKSELLPSVNSGTKTDSETGVAAAARIDSNPLEGDIVFVDGVPYIYNGNSWQTLVGQDIEDRVASLETQMQAIDGKILTAVNNAQHLKYQVVTSLPSVADATVNTVYLVGDSSTIGDNKYQEYLLVNSSFEQIGTFDTDLSGYVTTSDFNTAIGNLEDDISDLQSNLGNYVLISTYNSEVGNISDLRSATGDNNITIVDALVELDSHLTWNELKD